MLTVAEAMIHVRLDADTRKWLKSLAGAAGMGMTEYITALIRRDIESLSLEERRAIELLQGRLVMDSQESHTAKKNRRRAA